MGLCLLLLRRQSSGQSDNFFKRSEWQLPFAGVLDGEHPFRDNCLLTPAPIAIIGTVGGASIVCNTFVF